MNVDVDTSEVEQVTAELAAAGPKTTIATAAALAVTAKAMRDRAESLAPRDTGELAASIYLRGGGDAWYVGSDVRQGFFQEFGTSVMAPQPWLGPAAKLAQVDLARVSEKLGDPFD